MASIEDRITRTMDGTTYPNVARVVSPRAAGSDTLMTDGLSGWSTETAINFITYRTDSAGNVIEGTVRDWIGVANKVNSSIINLKLLAGPEDDGSNVGDIVQPCASASWADRLAQALLEFLDTDGKLKEGIVEPKNIKDKAITPDKIDFASLPMFSATTSKWIALEKTSDNNPKWNKVRYDTVDYNIGNMYDPNSFTATIPKNGIYHIDARVGIASTGLFSNYTAFMGIFKNDKLIKESTRTRGTDNDRHLPRPSLSVDLLLKKNDVIDIRAFCSDERDYGGDSTVSEFSMRFIGLV
jgi:hypothetical protein